MVPVGDGKAWTDTYLGRFAPPSDSVSFFADYRSTGSLVWGEFTARTADVKRADEYADAEAVAELGKIGAVFSKPWIGRLLGSLG